MAIATRLTARLGLEHPIILAPMAFAGGGRLAAAVSRAGGLGLIGGGYGDGDWLEAEFAAAGNTPVGCGFITWSLARAPHLLDAVLARAPRAVMLSFGDPARFAPAIRAAGATLICQVQSLAHARAALDAGAEVIVAQGAAAGGHSAVRATVTLVPEVADLCAAVAPETLVVAAGGIADGRGLAAALVLGADGVLMGSRFVAAEEALVTRAFQDAAVEACGDDTLRTRTVDIVRRRDWPAEFDIRVLRNAFVDRWHGNETALAAAVDVEAPRYQEALARGDTERAAVVVGEAVGLIREVMPAAEIIRRVVAEAEARLEAGAKLARR